jgi:hypothetical protein
MPSFSAGIRGVKRASLLGLFIGLCCGLTLAHADAVEEDRGGSFCLTPSLLLPSGVLASQFQAGGDWNLDFDVGISPAWSVIFGAGYADLKDQSNHDAGLLLVPAWFGFKSKVQLKPVELYWSAAGELVYEKAYVTGNTGTGSLENLDGGPVLGAGFDLWLTKWLLAGVESRAHFVIEGNQVYPLMELGLRLGIRG